MSIMNLVRKNKEPKIKGRKNRKEKKRKKRKRNIICINITRPNQKGVEEEMREK